MSAITATVIDHLSAWVSPGKFNSMDGRKWKESKGKGLKG